MTLCSTMNVFSIKCLRCHAGVIYVYMSFTCRHHMHGVRRTTMVIRPTWGAKDHSVACYTVSYACVNIDTCTANCKLQFILSALSTLSPGTDPLLHSKRGGVLRKDNCFFESDEFVGARFKVYYFSESL